jgi:hypothetical protein
VPTREANTRPFSCHLSPAVRRSLCCWSHCLRRASTQRSGSPSDRLDFGVFVSPPVRSARHT